MDPRKDRRLVGVLQSLADYRILSCSQMAYLHFGSKRAARRRFTQLCTDNYSEKLKVDTPFGQKKPEKSYGLGRTGFRLLQEMGILDGSLTFERVGGQRILREIGHQMILNWTRIHLVHLTNLKPHLHVSLHSANSGIGFDGFSKPAGPVCCLGSAGKEPVKRFLPDAAIIIRDTAQRRSVLFFLEVDRGTEPLSSSDQDRRAIMQKVDAYQDYFTSGEFRQYESLAEASLGGFQVLFVTETQQRMKSIAGMIRMLEHPDFILGTWIDCIFTAGVSGNIWIPGGKIEASPCSILRTQSCLAPLPGLRY